MSMEITNRTTSMQGVPTTVSVSGAFLQKCMNDSEKAAERKAVTRNLIDASLGTSASAGAGFDRKA